tara:strand:- start:227 stop:1462 length:1236 start_codon:yes stop_codon:yes gene_type:complete
MNTLGEYILYLLGKEEFITQWINGGFKEKPIVILGENGSGKTTFANHIIKDFDNISITIDFCKKHISLKEYLDSSLYKKSITMMFQQTHIYKSIIFDDLNYIQKNDKQLFKSIIDFSKKKITLHPVIYIISSLENKHILDLWKKSHKMKLSYTYDQIKNIVCKYFVKESISSTNVEKLLHHSNYNLNSVKANINYHKTNYHNIQTYENTDTTTQKFIKDLYSIDNTKDIYHKCSSDYSTIGLNILENMIPLLEKSPHISNREKIELISNIYTNQCFGDNLLTYIHISSNWYFINHITYLTIVYPIIITRRLSFDLSNITYNKYISKCIISTFHKKLFNKHSYDIVILSHLYHLLYLYQQEGCLSKKNEILIIVKEYIKLYKIPHEGVSKFMKYFSGVYDLHYSKKHIQLFY